MAGYQAFRDYGIDRTFADAVDSYSAAWALYDGSAFRKASGKMQGIAKGNELYRNTRLLYSQAASVGEFYASTIYSGSLATDGKRLPDGSRGAIPIDPQTGDEDANDRLLAAIATQWDRWRWQQGMALRPLYGSILGECLTELIDDPARHAAWPQLVWPGYVTGLDLDMVGDVKGYTIEYPITREENGKQVTFQYRKSVDREAYRYFRDDNLYDYDGNGAEQENPYEFVPAIWDRHTIGRDGIGMSAIANTRQALYELNSFLSNGIDYTAKTFNSPVVVRGGTGLPNAKTAVGPGRESDPRALAEQQDWVNASEGGGVEILIFDMGQARAIVQDLKAFILEANPEASFYHELRQMSTLTGPAVERALGDVTSRVTRARAGYDPQTVKLMQMATAICGYRYHDAGENGWRRNGGLTKRDTVFANFDLGSYVAGDLDMTILGRPVVPQTEQERVMLLLDKERLETVDSWVELGREKNDAEALIAARQTILGDFNPAGDLA